jgi:hypothetical protein
MLCAAPAPLHMFCQPPQMLRQTPPKASKAVGN